VRAYGRTKLAGELALRAAASRVRYIALRPTFVVDVHDILAIRYWSGVKRALAAHRHAHHVYVRDVADVLVWATARALAGHGAPGNFEVFNVAEDEFAEPSYDDFLRKAYAASGDRRFRVVAVPWPADWLRDFLKYRTLPPRNPFWRMRFPTDRLRAAGCAFRFGMRAAHELALDALRAEQRRAQGSVAR
jgi:nucleoside-diphosphate-sugar epimerase